jgi:hypothetical protein
METRETISLDARARRRLMVLTQVLAGELTLQQAAAYLGLSSRQVRRLAEGLAGPRGPAVLVHGNRGRVPVNRLDPAQRSRTVALAKTTYAGFNAAHLADMLTEEEPDLAVSARTLQRLLAEEGLASATPRRRPRHRSRRERVPREGMLVQADGSRHDWLEGRGPLLTLVGGIDDATSRFIGAVFREQEDAAGYLLVLAQMARDRGLPLGLYSDRHGIFIKDPGRPATLTEQLTGQRSLTQVGRALDELGIRWIGARSPQGKGRIERGWGTLQDRLTSELRRAGAETIGHANAVLARYLTRHNARFGVPAAIDEPAWLPWPSRWPIESVLSFHYPRRAAADDTLPWAGRSLAIPRAPGSGHGRRAVVVEEHLDGSLWARDGSAHVRLQEAPASAPVLRARGLTAWVEPDPAPEPERPDRSERPPSVASSQGASRPAPDHPWRRGYARRHDRPR